MSPRMRSLALPSGTEIRDHWRFAAAVVGVDGTASDAGSVREDDRQVLGSVKPLAPDARSRKALVQRLLQSVSPRHDMTEVEFVGISSLQRLDPP